MIDPSTVRAAAEDADDARDVAQRHADALTPRPDMTEDEQAANRRALAVAAADLAVARAIEALRLALVEVAEKIARRR